MARLIAVLIGGILIGAVTTYFFVGGANDTTDVEVVRDIVAADKMSESDAEQHREEHFVQLDSVEAAYKLPGVFARAEALYALAGRADAADVQRHISDANRIADETERKAALEILFERLTELDPQSALTLSRTNYFRGVNAYQQIVWSTWARNDLDEALFEAKSQTNLRDENMAAQSLYTAFGYLGNETTDRIEAELGIKPNRAVRGRYLYSLADRSPAEAIAYINGLKRRSDQSQQASWLAYYLSLSDPASAIGYAELLENASDRQVFERVLEANAAKENPEETIQRLLASGARNHRSGEFHGAARALVDTDLDAAKRYFEELTSQQDRQIFGSIIASRLAQDDPAAAVAWAREYSFGNENSHLEASVLFQIAETDPQLALSEALNVRNVAQRKNVLSNVFQIMARDDPQSAVDYLGQVPEVYQRDVRQQFVHSWMQHDPEAAVEWVLRQNDEISGELIQSTGMMLAHTDIDAAIRLLPRVADHQGAGLRQQIAAQLATHRSPAEAQEFINQFEGQPGYDHLQAAVISGIAQQDAFTAKQMADQLADSRARDQAYVQIINQHAQHDPNQAVQWLDSISNESMRGNATGMLARTWYMQNPEAATRWVMNLPSGNDRDDAILHMSSQWHSPTENQQRLIDSIDNREKRGQVKLRRVYVVMQTDPALARQLLQDSDISDQQRDQFENSLGSFRSFGVRSSRWRR